MSNFVSARSIAFSALRSGGLFGVCVRPSRPSSSSPIGRLGRAVCVFRSSMAAQRFAAASVARSGASFLAVRRVPFHGQIVWSVSIPIPSLPISTQWFRAGRPLATIPAS